MSGLQTSGDVAGKKCVDVAIAIIFREGSGRELLICRRKEGAVLGGFWEFPGGKCDAGEAPAACAVREVEEETGLHVEVTGELGVIEHEYPHARVRLHPFVCKYVDGILELRAVAEALWIVPGDVGRYRFPEANAGLIELIKNGRV